MYRSKVSWAVAAMLGLAPGAAFAQSSDAVTAEALFQEGKALLNAGDVAAACPKLAESHRLDPGTGTLLALAACHEQAGKLASAWAAYTEARARANRDGQTEREAFARQRAEALRPKLSSLTIEVAEEVAAIPGLEIVRDGGALGHAGWNAAIPIDGGEHVVEARAPGKLAWKEVVRVQPEADAQRVTVPKLADAPSTAAPIAIDTSTRASTDTGGSPRFETMQWAGLAVAGAGALTLGAGGYFLLSALGKKSDAEDDCRGDVCGQRGLSLRESAVDRGNVATVLGIAGAALVGTGVTLFLVGAPRSEEKSASSSAATVRADLVATGLTQLDLRVRF